MAIRTYEEMNAEFNKLYADGDFHAALDLLTREGGRFPGEEPMVLYLRSCMAARAEKPQLSLQLLQEALDKGYWYGDIVMRQTPSWQVFQGEAEFEGMVAECKRRQDEAGVASEVFTLEPEGGCAQGEVRPLVIALHGNGDNGEQALNGWRAVVDQGWLLASVQSSQPMAYGQYIWDDQETALREIGEQYASLQEKYGIDNGRLVIAGFSMGGETALRLALTRTLPVEGFILLGPGGPTVDEPQGWLPLLEEGKGRGLRGYVFMGEDDDNIEQPAVRELVEMLNNHGIPCELEMIPGIRHQYPGDFAPRLERALAFIEQRS